MSLGGDQTAAGVDDGLLGGRDQVEHALEFVIGGLGEGAERRVGEGDGGRENGRELGLLDVLGDVDDHGAGTAGAGEVEGFFDDAGQIGGVKHQVGVLHDGQGHTEEVGLLEGGLADELGEHLAGDGDHGSRVHVGVGNGGNEVGGAGSAGGHAHADFAGGAGVALGGEGTALLVAREDHADFVAAGEGLVEFLRGAAGIGEDHVNALAGEGLYDHVGTIHGAANFRLGKRRG